MKICTADTCVYNIVLLLNVFTFYKKAYAMNVYLVIENMRGHYAYIPSIVP